MRIAGRQKGSKVKPYTHVVVQPSAPKSRYTFSYHSSEDKAKAAAKKYERLVGNPLRVVKPFLIFLNYIKNDEYVGIALDPNVVDILRKI